MSEKPKTHQERAEKASYLVIPAAVDEWRAQAVRMIARETFPIELVEAARGMLERHQTQEQWDEAEDRLRSAMEAYKDPTP